MTVPHNNTHFSPKLNHAPIGSERETWSSPRTFDSHSIPLISIIKTQLPKYQNLCSHHPPEQPQRKRGKAAQSITLTHTHTHTYIQHSLSLSLSLLSLVPLVPKSNTLTQKSLSFSNPFYNASFPFLPFRSSNLNSLSLSFLSLIYTTTF